MRTTPRAVALAITLSMFGSAAAWSAHGGHEPDHAADVAASLMWPDAPGTAQGRLYFAVTGGSLGGEGNPNVALLETRIQPVGEVRFTAILGVWVDCNADGYVGLAETAAREYPADLLRGSTRCPPRFGPAQCHTSAPGGVCPNWPATDHHNYNGWVTELIPIGGADATATDRRVIRDPDAIVWGDAGLPSDAHAGSPKIATDIAFGFTTMSRGGLPLGGLTGSAGAPNDAGLMQGSTVCPVCRGSEWLATRAWSLDAEPTSSEATRFTFYARVGAVTLATPGVALPGGSGTYGDAQCGPHTSGVHQGWSCDAADWNAGSAVVGTTYQLRDVDCYDGRVATPAAAGQQVAVGAAVAFYAEPCDR